MITFSFFEMLYSSLETGRQPALRAQLLQQRLRFLQIARVEAFGEPIINRRQQFARLLPFALVAPEAGEAHGCAEFRGFGLVVDERQQARALNRLLLSPHPVGATSVRCPRRRDRPAPPISLP
jgi:hypothetical protein